MTDQSPDRARPEGADGPGDRSDRQPEAAATECFPSEGCLLGIDFGTKRIGVAYCDALQLVATPLHNYRRGSLNDDEQFFQAVIRDYQIVGAVVGLPVHISGDESRKSRQARDFAAWLTRRTSLPVQFQDERYSSVQADAQMNAAGLSEKRRKDSIDMVAARIILDDFLRSGG
ncbi:MAG: Holliday junction resolvase RuvX [Planctomycetaceae bacterium]|nr:Holliday junction resolvase RuvX [Planctomycetaceae bacterium]